MYVLNGLIRVLFIIPGSNIFSFYLALLFLLFQYFFLCIARKDSKLDSFFSFRFNLTTTPKVKQNIYFLQPVSSYSRSSRYLNRNGINGCPG